MGKKSPGVEPDENADESDEDGSAAHGNAPPYLKNDAVIAGILLVILGLIFWTSNHPHPAFQSFYKWVPMLLMCYFIPSLLTSLNIVDPEESKLYFVASRYFLPASLVLLTISIDLGEVVKLGPKAIIMFLTGSVGVILGGPLSILLFSCLAPDMVGGQGPDAVWRGLATIAGSWIGGAANQAAMKEVFGPSKDLFTVMVTIDVLVAEFWMLFLLLGVGKANDIDRFFRADSTAIESLKDKMQSFAERTARIPTTTDLMVILAAAFGVTGLCHFLAGRLAPWIGESYPVLRKFSLDSEFFWLIVLATTGGLLLSFTRLRNLEGVGASRIGTAFIFFLVATIGMKMDVTAIYEHRNLFLVGLVWMLIHVGLMFFMAWLIRAPYFFLAVGSKANIGGAASAPVVAAAFHPALAPVGVLLAVVGYALGTYGAYVCGLLMQQVAPGTM